MESLDYNSGLSMGVPPQSSKGNVAEAAFRSETIDYDSALGCYILLFCCYSAANAIPGKLSN